MNYGLYTAFLGMRARQRTLDAQANNIANASTTGFKAERLAYSTFEADRKSETDKQNLVAGAATTNLTDFSTGSFQQTGRALDIAIEGDAFLQIQTKNGVRYTKAGNLSLTSSGQLVTKNGDLVVGDRGGITLPTQGNISIGGDGSISVDGALVDKLKLVRFNNPTNALTQEGNSFFVANGTENPSPNTNSRVIQGSLESSNINAVSEMVAMINNNREFESLQKSVTLLMNDLGRKIAGEIGRI
jgi:flagellar basal-body rod protein FlgF